MGYYEYQKKLDAVMGEVLEAMEQTNGMEKYALAFCKKGDIVGHFRKGNTGNMPKWYLTFWSTLGHLNIEKLPNGPKLPHA